MSGFHPDLARFARWVPRFSMGPRNTRLIRNLGRRDTEPKSQPGVKASSLTLPSGHARLFVPEGVTAPMPAMLWIHGGGHVIGHPSQDDDFSTRFARELKMTVLAPRFRLGIEAPAPASLDDLYTALTWLHANAKNLNVRTDQLVIAGASAGGGLAAGLTLLARDRKAIPIAFQLLVYPMLDDRTVDRAIDDRNVRVWSTASNRFGWSSLLGGQPPTAYSVPARAEDLTGLPPTWIGVGSFDLFHDEDVEYARRLKEAGVPVKLDVIPGAFHGFDAVARKSSLARAFFQMQVDALRSQFGTR